MSWWMQLIACLIASIAYSVLVRLPHKCTLITSLIAVAGYGVFLLLNESTMGYFLATLVIGFSCEICARIMKRAATIFMTGAIIPLVPGVGLYRTMRYVVEGEARLAMTTGTATLLGLCSIALAMTISTVFFSSLRLKLSKKDTPC